MNSKRDSQQVYESEFPQIRAKLLELAAGLDRIDRATGSLTSESEMALIREAIQTLLSSDSNRAEQIQLLFSRAYEGNWRADMEL